MSLGEKIKTYRTQKGLSQEKLAELMDVSRQAVTKWEKGESSPSTEKLIRLAEIFEISLDELALEKGEKKKPNKILRSNLTLIAIVLQASALNVCMQPPIDGVPVLYNRLTRLPLLLVFSIWMVFNLNFEKDRQQYLKNVKIELLYCAVQAIIFLIFYQKPYRFAGTLLIMAVLLFYIFYINPKYMKRTMYKKKDKQGRT